MRIDWRGITIVLCLFLLLACKSRESLDSVVQADKNSFASRLESAIEFLKTLSPEAAEAAILFRNITLAQHEDADLAAPGKAAQNGSVIKDAFYVPYANGAFKPYGHSGYDPYGQGIYGAEGKNHVTKLGGYKNGHVTSRNDGLINHFIAIRALNSAAGNDLYLRDLGLFVSHVHDVDQNTREIYGTQFQSTTSRPRIDYVGPDLFEGAKRLMRSNVFRAVSVMGDVGHDDFDNYKIGQSSNLYAVGVLGADVKVQNAADLRFKFAADRLNKAEPQNGQDLGGAYNYQMIAGFYMGCQMAKWGVDRVRVNKSLIVDRVLGIALQGYFGGNGPDQCLKDFLDERVCKQAQGKGAFALLGNLASQVSQDYEFDLATDLPALAGYYYKVISLEMRVRSANSGGKDKSGNDGMELLEKGYINPFMYDDEDLSRKDNPYAPANNFPIPDGWDAARMRKAVLSLDARLAHIRYVMEQHLRGAAYGKQVCNEYKSELKKAFASDPVQETLMSMGYLSPGFTSEDVKARYTFKKYFPKGVPDTDLEAAVQSLNEKFQASTGVLDYYYPNVIKFEPKPVKSL